MKSVYLFALSIIFLSLPSSQAQVDISGDGIPELVFFAELDNTLFWYADDLVTRRIYELGPYGSPEDVNSFSAWRSLSAGSRASLRISGFGQYLLSHEAFEESLLIRSTGAPARSFLGEKLNPDTVADAVIVEKNSPRMIWRLAYEPFTKRRRFVRILFGSPKASPFIFSTRAKWKKLAVFSSRGKRSARIIYRSQRSRRKRRLRLRVRDLPNQAPFVLRDRHGRDIFGFLQGKEFFTVNQRGRKEGLSLIVEGNSNLVIGDYLGKGYDQVLFQQGDQIKFSNGQTKRLQFEDIQLIGKVEITNLNPSSVVPPTETATPEPTNTSVGTPTSVVEPTQIQSPSPTGASTPVVSPTPAATPTITPSVNPTSTSTPIPTFTATITPVATVISTPTLTPTPTITPTPTSTPTLTLTDVNEMAPSGLSNHNCVVTSVGAVKCWGSNTHGQLGDGTQINRTNPVDVQGLSSGISKVVVGVEHTCALTTSGGVKCWGRGDFGRLGNSGTATSLTPVDVTGLSSGVTTLALSNHSCAIVAGGELKCWGFNGDGRLGDGTTLNRLEPTTVTGLTSGVTDVALGNTHTCAIQSGQAKCWGGNASGRLGDGTTSQRNTPTDVLTLPTTVSNITAGNAHSCASLSSGALYCWGNNANGRLGDGTVTLRLSPELIMASGVSSVYAGNSHTCALLDSGSVSCWGRNTSGELGDGTTTERRTSVSVSGLTSNVAQLSTGEAHNCVRMQDKSVRCWGKNDLGQLGNGLISAGQLEPGSVILK